MGSFLLISFDPTRVRPRGEFTLEVSPSLSFKTAGTQVVPKEEWEAACKNPVRAPIIEALLNDQAIVIKGETDGDRNALMSIRNSTQAIRMMRETFDLKLLETWLAVDDRNEVCLAIEDHIKSIKEKALTEEAKEKKRATNG